MNIPLHMKPLATTSEHEKQLLWSFAFIMLMEMSHLRYYFLQFCSFICQVASARSQRKWPFRSSSKAASCYYQYNRSMVEAIALSALLKGPRT